MSNKFVYFFAFFIASRLFGLDAGFAAATTAVVEDAPARLQALARADVYRAQSKGLSRRYWPTVEVQSGYQISDSPVNVFMQRLSQRQFVQEDFAIDRLNHPGFHNDWASSIGIGGLLWERGGLSYQQAAADKLARASEISAEGLTGAILVNWTDLQLRARAVEDSRLSIEEQLKALDEELAQAQSLEDQGVALGADVALAEAVRAGLAAKLDDLDAQHAQIKAGLKELAGSDVDGKMELNLADFVAGEIRPSPAVRSAQLGVASAQDGITSASRGNDLSLGWSVQEQSHLYGAASAASTMAYVGLNWTLFDPQKSSRVAAARAQERARQAELTAARRTQQRSLDELSATLDSLKASQVQLVATRDNLDHSLEHLLPLYRDGRKSIADLAQLRQKLSETDLAVELNAAAITSTSVALLDAREGLSLNKYLTIWK